MTHLGNALPQYTQVAILSFGQGMLVTPFRAFWRCASSLSCLLNTWLHLYRQHRARILPLSRNSDPKCACAAPHTGVPTHLVEPAPVSLTQDNDSRPPNPPLPTSSSPPSSPHRTRISSQTTSNYPAYPDTPLSTSPPRLCLPPRGDVAG